MARHLLSSSLVGLGLGLGGLLVRLVVIVMPAQERGRPAARPGGEGRAA